MERFKFARKQTLWTQALNLFGAYVLAAALSLALPACNSGGGSAGDAGSSTVSSGGLGDPGGSGSGGTQQQLTPSQQQLQTIVSQYNALPNYTLSASDIQMLSSQGLLQGNDQTTLNSLVSNN